VAFFCHRAKGMCRQVFACRLEAASSQLEELAKTGGGMAASKALAKWCSVVDELIETLNSTPVGQLSETTVITVQARLLPDSGSSSVASVERSAPVVRTKGLSDALAEVQAAKAALHSSFEAQMKHLEGIEAALSGEDAKPPPVFPQGTHQTPGSDSATSSLETSTWDEPRADVLDLGHLEGVPDSVIKSLMKKYFETPVGLTATLQTLQSAVDTNAEAGATHGILHKFAGEVKYVGASRVEACLLRMHQQPAEMTTRGMAELLALIDEAKQALRARGLL